MAGQLLINLKPFHAPASKLLRLLPRFVEGAKPDAKRENDAQSQIRPSETQNQSWPGNCSPASLAIPAAPNQKDASLTPRLPPATAVRALGSRGALSTVGTGCQEEHRASCHQMRLDIVKMTALLSLGWFFSLAVSLQEMGQNRSPATFANLFLCGNPLLFGRVLICKQPSGCLCLFLEILFQWTFSDSSVVQSSYLQTMRLLLCPFQHVFLLFLCFNVR